MTYADQEMRGATLYAKLLEVLAYHSPATYDDIIEYTGLSYHTVMRYCKAMMALNRPVIRIASWGEDIRGRLTKPMFELTFSQQPNIPRPRRTQAELAAYQKQRRLDKKKRSQTSVFNIHVPRYAKGTKWLI